MQLKVEYLPLDEITPYARNAKKHPQEQVDQIKESIRQFGFNDPLALWHGEIVEGNGRYIAAAEMGLEAVPVIRLDDLTDKQRRAYALVHNKLTMNSEFDRDVLDLELADLDLDLDMGDFGFDELSFDYSDYLDRYADGKVGSLSERFIVPPFSVLDATQGYWQERKKQWRQITGDLSETRDGDYGKVDGGSALFDTIANGTSNFDPVLAEIMYKWFCPDKGKILDPFGGEQTKGVVAGELGLQYTGVEIRPEQVELNRGQVARYKNIEYICGDSNNIDALVHGDDYDFCFTSPPYYDLEVYSKDDLSSLGSYEEFMRQYANIFAKCYKKLKDDSFLVLKVGEIRNKKTGEYRGFVPDNIRIMNEIGFKFYNEIILVTPVGTAAIRATKSMATRKVVKRHQNILVFYKGNLANIGKKFKVIDFSDSEMADE